MKNKTLAEVDAEYFALIMSCHEAVINEMDNPEFVRVCPPQRIKRREVSFTHGA